MPEPLPLNVGNSYKLVVAPIVAKLQLGATLNQNVTFDSEGCAALAKVMSNMAERLDVACAMFQALEEEEP